MNLGITKDDIHAISCKIVEHRTKQQNFMRRQELFHDINGDIFYPMSQWPLRYERMFWGKPITDDMAFQLFLFFVGNGGSPHIAVEWILLSQCWSNDKLGFLKRRNQLQWIIMNIDDRQSAWFTWSIFFSKLTFLNGNPK